jgi:hypothetical protein
VLEGDNKRFTLWEGCVRVHADWWREEFDVLDAGCAVGWVDDCYHSADLAYEGLDRQDAGFSDLGWVL